ncbi:uncharacterized protein LOC123531721 [Mercenaria mercenaria]|uniref:uncharacterized protein LOC123531721 n=1 Tax=Mercenaria mercenaria TaxID=6596 RepID=UPI00234F8CEA|nr:uncharacterized protein LOC123531721 [Mercenaria mercenaria]
MSIFGSIFFFIFKQLVAGLSLKNYTDYGSLSTIHEVADINCYQEPCRFTAGHNYTGYMTFTPKVNHAVANLHLYIILNGQSSEFENGVNQCGHGLECPIHAGEKTSWIMTQSIPLMLNDVFKGLHTQQCISPLIKQKVNQLAEVRRNHCLQS